MSESKHKLSIGDLVLVRDYTNTESLCQALDDHDGPRNYNLVNKHSDKLKVHVGKIMLISQKGTGRLLNKPLYYLVDNDVDMITDLVAVEEDLDPLFTK